jgi:peptidoglycan/LPS O-acetylase OafA/YrhL
MVITNNIHNNITLISTPDTFHLGYRSDIEGLRAVAILLVVAAHAGVPWLAGGFIGVDVFFVLSGYLITGLLLQEIRKTGHLQLVRFYTRRFRRLLPALLFMLLCISVLSITLLAPFEQLNQIPAAQAASIWASNLYFSFTDFNYFSQASDKNLFLHTWSLGVEEQFYLVWPFFLMFLLKCWNWQNGNQDFKHLKHLKHLKQGMIVTIILCLILSIFSSYTKPLWGFYLMPSRIWQFALGALTFLWTIEKEGNINGLSNFSVSDKIFRRFNLSGWIGIFLIIVSALLLDSNISYPSGWAILPSMGTVLVLLAGATTTPTRVARVLSIPPLLWVGRVSYSWYLWHWPVLVLGGLFFWEKTEVVTILLVIISLACAIFSYRFIESPIRFNKQLSKQTKTVLVVALFLMLTVVVLCEFWQRTATSWSTLPKQQLYHKVRSNSPIIYAMGCDQWFYSSDVNICAFGDKNPTKTAVLVGDSIMGQWFPALAAAYNNPGWQLMVLTKSSCPMVDEPIFYKRIGMEYTVCSQWRDKVLTVLASIKPDIVFMGGISSSDFSKNQWISGTKRILDKISPITKDIVIIRSTHSLPFDGPGCLARRAWQPPLVSALSDCRSVAGNQHEKNVFSWLMEAAKEFKNVSVIDLNPIICPNGFCYAEKDGKIIFRDSQHLSARYVETLSHYFVPLQ